MSKPRQNPWRDDDAAFRDAALALLNLREAHRGLKAEEFLLRLLPEELDHFAEAFAHRYYRWSHYFSTFPVAGESSDVCVLREINDTFGASLLKVHSTSVVDERQAQRCSERQSQGYEQQHDFVMRPASEQFMSANDPTTRQYWGLERQTRGSIATTQ